MSQEREVLIYPNKNVLTAAVVARFITTMSDVLEKKDEAHIVLTGGSLGIAVLGALNESAAKNAINWKKVHFWWGDERFVPKNDPERNELQARNALLNSVKIDPKNVHPFPASDQMLSLDDAAGAYAHELEKNATLPHRLPKFDITFLGVGPDGHIASLFPGLPGIREKEATVVTVTNSPKPPPERLSLTLPVLQSSDHIWLVLAGTDKASALSRAVAGASCEEIPAAGAHGKKSTVFFVDHDAAAKISHSFETKEDVNGIESR